MLASLLLALAEFLSAVDRLWLESSGVFVPRSASELMVVLASLLLVLAECTCLAAVDLLSLESSGAFVSRSASDLTVVSVSLALVL